MTATKKRTTSGPSGITQPHGWRARKFAGRLDVWLERPEWELLESVASHYKSRKDAIIAAISVLAKALEKK